MFAQRMALVLLASWSVTLGVALAQEESEHCAPPPAAPCCSGPTAATLCGTKVVLFGRGEICVEPELNVRQVVTKIPTVNVAVTYKEEKRCVTVMVPKARTVERVVQSINYEPVTKYDSCTGCPCITYKAVPICKTEKYQVFEAVPETKEMTVQVPVFKTVPTETTVKQYTADWSSGAVAYTRYGALVMPSNVTVPVCPCPLPPPPPIICPPPCPGPMCAPSH